MYLYHPIRNPQDRDLAKESVQHDAVEVRVENSLWVIPPSLHSVPRPNYYLSTLTNLKDKASDVDYLASSKEDFRDRPCPHQGPEPESPLPRRLQPYREASNTSPIFNFG